MKISFLFLFFCCSSVVAQNLVPNSSFEEYAVCPGSYSQAVGHFKLPDWSSPNIGTPDHYHACSEGDADVPYNWAGVADAFDGKGYVGLFLWMRDKDYREYMQCRLQEPLIKDTLYTIEFHYKLSSYSKYSIDRIGLMLTEHELKSRNDRTIEMNPTFAVVQDSALTKSTGLWEKASVQYKAQGGEQYLTIGNFWSQETVKSYEIRFRPVSEQMLAAASYYYVDDVRVTRESYLANQRRLAPPVEYDNLKANTNYVLRNIQFEFDSYRLLKPSFEELDKLATFLLQHPRTRIQIFGHTDDQGGAVYNKRLSERRAKNVGNYLTSVGVDPSRIESFGFGKEKPLLRETTEEARNINRRVEIRFLQ